MDRKFVIKVRFFKIMTLYIKVCSFLELMCEINQNHKVVDFCNENFFYKNNIFLFWQVINKTFAHHLPLKIKNY